MTSPTAAPDPATATAPATEARSIWNVRAERVAQQALDAVIEGIDAIPAASLLLAVLRAEVGELPADDAADLDASFRREEDPDAGCICPPDLLARGGHRGGCPVHSLIAARALTDKPSTGIPPVRIRETITSALAGEEAGDA